MHLTHIELFLRAPWVSCHSSELSRLLAILAFPYEIYLLAISSWGEVFELSAHLQMFLFFFLSSFLLPSSVATLAQPLCLIYDRAVVLVVIGSVVLPSLLGLWWAEVNSKDWVWLIEQTEPSSVPVTTSGFFQASHQASLGWLTHATNNRLV